MKHSREHRLSDSELRSRLGLQTIDVYISRRQLGWAGHLARMPFERLPRKMLSSWVRADRPIGAPQFTYARGLLKALGKAGIDSKTWHQLAQDREGCVAREDKCPPFLVEPPPSASARRSASHGMRPIPTALGLA